MSPLETKVRAYLDRCREPQTAAAITDAVQIRIATDVPTVRTLLGRMVRQDIVTRHHTPEGLKYSSTRRGARVTLATPKTAPGTHQSPRPDTMQGRILAALAGRWMTSRAIAESTGIHQQQVTNALAQLRHRGFAEHTGVGRETYWQSTLVPPAMPNMPSTQESLQSVLGQAMDELLAAKTSLRRALILLADADELPPYLGERMRDGMDEMRLKGVED